MSAALGAFFGAPIGADLFALEIIAAIFSFAIFRLNTGISIGGMYHFNVVPQTLFFSEEQIETVIQTGATLSVGILIAIAVAKMFAISFTLHSGFLGGFIFPLFFISANVGLAISLAIPEIHPTVAMVCLMAAVNVAVTKTPISTSIILSVLSGTAMLPVIAISSFVSFIFFIYRMDYNLRF